MTVINDFITEDEQAELLDWTRSNDIPVLQPPNLPPSPVFPQRKKIFDDDGPPAYYDIQTRIAEYFDLADRKPSGWNGQVFIHQPEMGTREHIDGGGNGTFRMTLMIQRAEEGGDLIHDQSVIDIPERGLAAFDASIPHSVSHVVSGERIVFIFFWSDS